MYRAGNTSNADLGIALRRAKTGGRMKGTPNKKTAERHRILLELKVSGKDPVSFFAAILANESAPLDLRFQAAKELAPYVHPRLQAVESRPSQMSHEDRPEMYRRMLADAAEDRAKPTLSAGYPVT
jgi:hypothetical protein